MSEIVQQCLKVLADLPSPDPSGANGHVFSAAPFPSSRNHRIAKDAAGNVAVLIALDPSQPVERGAPIVLEHLNVLHAANCRVSGVDGQADSGLFSVVTCTAHEHQLVRQFITLLSSLVLSLPAPPSSHEAATAIRQMIQLFRALKKPGTRSIQGLWAELYVINTAADPRALIGAWRMDPTEQFDFAEGASRLEVKSTRLAQRVHTFTLPQLNPPVGVAAIIASLRTPPASNGLSLRQLWDEVRGRVADDPALMLRVDRAVITSLGRAWRRGMDRAFDSAVARASLIFFRTTSIPSVAATVPPEVTDVRFRSNIGSVSPLTMQELQSSGPLFLAAAPGAH